MKDNREQAKQLYVNYLLHQTKNSRIIKEGLTVAKYEQFQEWIKNLDYKTIKNIIKEGDIEDIVTALVQAKGKDVPGLSQKSKTAKEILDIAIEKAENECKGKCSEDKRCFLECLVDKLQHMIGSLKTEKDKCKGWSKQKCYDRFDKVIEIVSNKTEALVHQLKGK
jgi:hypothetical protein